MLQRGIERRRIPTKEINSNSNGWSQDRCISEIIFSGKDSAECMGFLWVEKEKAGEEERMRHRGKNEVSPSQ